MTEPVLTRERILETAEGVLRRYGPAKATVVDVARALGVSHGSVYRHFPSKVALRDAVAERWLARIAEPLAQVTDEPGTGPEQLRRWLERLMASKHSHALEDPELFATYVVLVTEAREVAATHVAHLLAQLERIVADGQSRGEFVAGDPAAAARAILSATARFHYPVHAREWGDPALAAAFEEVWALLLRGLT